jgi:excisionase family DNA binding protein
MKKPEVEPNILEAGKHRRYSLASSINAMHRALRAEELANLLGMKKVTILRRAKKGSIPCFHIGGSVRFDSSAIAKWLMTQGVVSLAPKSVQKAK